MCVSGVKISELPSEKPVQVKGLAQAAPKAVSETAIKAKLSNPLAIPLKVPGMG